MGYRGNKCQACDVGYSRTSENKCSKCPGQVANAFRLIGMIMILAVVCAVLVRSSINTSYQPILKHSIYLKIFTNYLQLVLLTTQLDLQWPSFVYELFSVQKNTGTLTDQFLSVDCYLNRSGDEESYKNVYFEKLEIMAAIPLIFSFAAAAFWGVHFAVKRDSGVFKKQCVATLVILFFLIHPNLIRSNFAYFSCTEILSGEFWLNENLDIRCFDHNHNSFAVSIVLPSLVTWGLLVPSLVLLYLTRQRRDLSEILTKLRFGFLYNGFTKSKFYWEFVIMFRKILIICIVVFIGNQSIPIQALTVILLLLNFLVLQYLTRPYANNELNEMELRSVLVAAVTIYCGLYYLTDDLGEVAKALFFTIMLLTNLYFFYYFLAHLVGSYSAEIAKIHPVLRRILREPLPNPYPEVTLRAPSYARKTILVGDQRTHTLVSPLQRTKPRLGIKSMKDLCASVIRGLLIDTQRMPITAASDPIV
jgi:hypothetical protein